MRGVNRVILVGNLGKEPVVKLVSEGVSVASFALATTEIYRLKNGDLHHETQWHTVVLWRGLAGLAERFLKKGSLVLVEGHIRYRMYEDRDGIRRSKTDIVADRLLMLDKAEPKKGEAEDGFYDDQILPF